MKKNLLTALSILCTIQLFAQSDTITSQIIEFSDGLSNRRAWRALPPDDGTTYRKILMYQTLKCDKSLISNPTNSGCGEWDAGANFILYKHLFQDSLRYMTGNAIYPDTVNYVNDPTYSYYQHKLKRRVIDKVINNSTYTVGSIIGSVSPALGYKKRGHFSQFLYRAPELQAAGLKAGRIDRISFDLSSNPGDNIDLFSIGMKHSSIDTMTSDNWSQDGFTEVYSYSSDFKASSNKFTFLDSFVWDGTSNIIIQFRCDNHKMATPRTAVGGTQSKYSGVYCTIDDGYLTFDEGDYLEIPIEGDSISTEVTVCFWANVDKTSSQKNALVFDARDSNGYRVMASRFINGSNGSIWWHAGNSRTSAHDRINIGINDIGESFEENWNHFAYTKNSATGEQKIYMNGSLILSETGKSRSMEGIARILIGGGINDNRPYFGKLNDFSIWNKELDSSTIQYWMNRDLHTSHPDYANLVCYYKFDEVVNYKVSDYVSGKTSALLGTPEWAIMKSHETHRNVFPTRKRVNITFHQGTYNSHLDSSVVTDTMENTPISLISSELYRDFDKIGLQDNYQDTMYKWAPGNVSNTYDDEGNVINSDYVAPDNTVYNYYNIENNRIGRYITPYGNYLDLGEGFTWIYDVTDFEPLLHDTIDFQGGDGRELIDCKFEFIKGTPPRTVNNVEKVLPSESNKYEFLVLNPPTDTLYPDPQSETFGLKYSVTGHSFNNPPNCAEFCAREHSFKLNGNEIHKWLHMRECSDNPLYPQGGTWIYDRTGWCPGAKVQVWDKDLTPYLTKGQDFELQYNVEKDPTGTEYGNWSREMHFISYSDYHFKNDAEISNIVAPTNWEFYSRFNPTCDNAIVEVRNTGGDTLRSVTIEYSVKGGKVLPYTWYGALPSMETTRITLPMYGPASYDNDGENTFIAKVVSANGKPDEYSKNNELTSTYDVTPQYTSGLIVLFRTNLAPEENKLTLSDANGKIWLFKDGADLSPNTIYRDTVYVDLGCYTLKVEDSGNDGLSFWNNNDGSGLLFISNISNKVLKTFDGDFGHNINHHFTVGYTLNLDEIKQLEKRVSVFPNPSSGIVNVEWSSLNASIIDVEVIDQFGKLVTKEQFDNESMYMLKKIDLSDVTAGVYYIKINDGGIQFVRPIVLK
jgi:hypothetical protein